MSGTLLRCPGLTVNKWFQDDTSYVVSTVLFVSGITTLLHTSFGTRLPLIQGPSFVYLAPALVIINSPEFLGLSTNVCFSSYLLSIWLLNVCSSSYHLSIWLSFDLFPFTSMLNHASKVQFIYASNNLVC